MTDLFSVEDEVTPSLDTNDYNRPCAREGCTEFVPLGSRQVRLYCDTHFVGSTASKRKSKDRRPRSNPNISINLPGPSKPNSKDKRADEVTAGAQALLTLIVSGIALAGDDVCAAAWNGAIPQIAAQLGELSKYHPGLTKIFAPIGEESEFGVWLGLSFAMAPAVIATLSHHHLMPQALAQKITGVAVAATEVAGSGAAAA